jgi:cation diffusion facilitator CzcD-associated flavoprotein CzcO
MQTRHVRVAIVGSGFAGIRTGIRLKQDRIDDFGIPAGGLAAEGIASKP